MKLQKITKTGISILATIIVSYWLVSAWTNLTTVSTWNTLTATTWNDMITKVNETGNRVSGIFTSWSNVWIWTITPSAPLEVAGKIIRTIDYATANWPGDDTDQWQIVSRVLNLTKLKTSTKLRIGYTDNLRVYSGVFEWKACRWEIRVDWVSCPNQPLVYDFYKVLASENPLHSGTLVGYCSWLTSGAHQIQIWVWDTPGYTGSDCYTWWAGSTWVIDSEEVN